METDIDFTNKVVIITGSSSGMGAATALLFAKKGAKLVIHGRSEDKIKEMVNMCNAVSPTNEKALGVSGDVTNDEDIRRLVQETVTNFGQIDVLVNNAGLGSFDSIDDPKLMETFDNMMNINLRSVVLLCHIAIPYLAKSKGNIVNISTALSGQSLQGYMCYSAAKAGIDMLTKTLAIELGPKHIRVNSVNPGVVKTPFFERGGASKEEAEAIAESYNYTYPMGKVGAPRDVSRAVAFLASEKSGFITGTIMLVDGGLSIVNAMASENLKKVRSNE